LSSRGCIGLRAAFSAGGVNLIRSFDHPSNSQEYAAMKAVWKGTVVAESNDTVVVEGNHYFPLDSIRPEYLLPSNTKTMCSWKGQASYHTLFVNGDANPDAVWYYPEPKEAAAEIKGRIAFWKGVTVVE
jgi:uncharacterized protein (DUF427 family)